MIECMSELESTLCVSIVHLFTPLRFVQHGPRSWRQRQTCGKGSLPHPTCTSSFARRPRSTGSRKQRGEGHGFHNEVPMLVLMIAPEGAAMLLEHALANCADRRLQLCSGMLLAADGAELHEHVCMHSPTLHETHPPIDPIAKMAILDRFSRPVANIALESSWLRWHLRVG